MITRTDSGWIISIDDTPEGRKEIYNLLDEIDFQRSIIKRMATVLKDCEYYISKLPPRSFGSVGGGSDGPDGLFHIDLRDSLLYDIKKVLND